MAAAIGVWGPTLLAGRAISLIATLALGTLVFVAARSRSNIVGGLVAAGLFWLSNYVFHVTPLARVNALAALLALAGLLCIVRARRGWLVAGGLLLLAALYTKPTAIDALVAALVYLWRVQPRLALLFGGSLAALGLLAAGLLEAATQRAFSLNVLFGNVNPFVPGQLREYLLNFGLLHAVPLTLAGFAAVRTLVERRADLLALYLGAGLLMSLGVGKWGAGESYFLSAIVASSILAGQVAGRLARSDDYWARLLPIFLVLQCFISAHGFVSGRWPSLPDRGLQAAALATEPGPADLERGWGIVDRLKATDGPGLIEDPGFELAAGKHVIGNATHLRNLHQSGLWRPDRLVADVVARRYHTVVLDAELYPEPVLAAIGRHYFLYDTVLVHRATQQVFLPGAS